MRPALLLLGLSACAGAPARDPSPNPSPSPSPSAEPAPPPLDACHIHFDFRFAHGWFDEPVRRAELDYIAQLWTRMLHDRWRPYPAGATFSVWNYQTNADEDVTLDAPVTDGLLVFVQATPLGSDGLKAQGGYSGDWQPSTAFAADVAGTTAPTWVGNLVINTDAGRPWFFDATPETSWDVPMQTDYDFVTTIVHELGHVLGFLLGPYEQRGYLSGDTFTGPRAQALFGGPVPLLHESSHLADAAGVVLPRPWINQHAMQGAALVPGIRSIPSALDAAMLADLGWSVDPSRLQPSDDDPPPGRHAPARPLGDPPIGLWDLRHPDDLYHPVIGRPLKFLPARDAAARTGPPTIADGALRVPSTAALVVDHGLAAQAPGDCVNHYSLAWRVRIPALGVAYPLLNTNDRNANGADADIDASGHFGEGRHRAPVALTPGQWVTLAVTVDTEAALMTFWQDGAAVATRDAGPLDGRFSINSVTCGGPRLLLFADPTMAGAIDVAGVALWDHVVAAATLDQVFAP